MAFRGYVGYQKDEKEKEDFQYLNARGSVSATVVRKQLSVNTFQNEKGCFSKFFSIFSTCSPNHTSQYKKISSR